MKEISYYSECGVYPKIPQKPFLNQKATASDARAYADALEAFEIEMNSYEEKKNAYYKKQSELHEEFMKDLFEHFGVSQNPKARLCFEKAWDRGHSYGYEGVMSCFEDIVDLIV